MDNGNLLPSMSRLSRCSEMRYEVEGERESEMTHRQSRWVEVDQEVHSVLSLPCRHVPSVLVERHRKTKKATDADTERTPLEY